MIVFVDCETTGLNPQQDRILQLSAIKVDEAGKIVDVWDHYLKPVGAYEISPSATEVHGLTKEFIEENGENFKEIGPSFVEFINGCDVAGYNSNNFDWKFIYNELFRVGLDLDMDRTFYDVLSIERKLRPCDLNSVYTRYMGQSMEEAGLDAHNSLSDVIATAKVFMEQLKVIPEGEDLKSWGENQLFSPEGSIRNAGTKERPVLVFTMGKYRDSDVFDILNRDPDYCSWWSRTIATTHSRKAVTEYCKRRNAEIK